MPDDKLWRTYVTVEIFSRGPEGPRPGDITATTPLDAHVRITRIDPIPVDPAMMEAALDRHGISPSSLIPEAELARLRSPDDIRETVLAYVHRNQRKHLGVEGVDTKLGLELDVKYGSLRAEIDHIIAYTAYDMWEKSLDTLTRRQAVEANIYPRSPDSAGARASRLFVGFLGEIRGAVQGLPLLKGGRGLSEDIGYVNDGFPGDGSGYGFGDGDGDGGSG